ncbi:hypothetical protein DERP_013449 [Dermatophagoides pteronyssinus]|uniref:Peptidase M20 dimerisation domain-containing protein n=1 Tax=Dermatophagoides pteronyssinus TaxID=6956 RepID=A0ABQ8JRM7_DERPT|nr:hypothetical protein DERP_013449 [Dermatophagoides pteronyssinus]
MAIFTGKILSLLMVIIIPLFVLFFRAEIYFPYPNGLQICNETHEPIQGDNLIERFAQAIRIKTITLDRGVYDREELLKFAQFLRKNFPTIYSSPLVTYETVNNYSLLYHVKGSDSSLKPYLLCSHMDVVPVELDKWDVDPFGGIIKDNNIYGRGTIDVKDTLMAIMESLEYLLKNNFQPQRSFYIAFGHDEEATGKDGAQEIAKTLHRKGIKEFEFLLDEGMFVFSDGFPGIKQPVALVGVAEKGFLSVILRSNGSVGHSSMPPHETSITTLAKALSKFTSDAHINYFGYGPERRMFEELARYASYPYKLFYSNLWLFGPIIAKIMSSKPGNNAFVRTTTAPTIINGGFKENVLPSEATAVINHRIHPMQTAMDVFEYDRQLINDERIELTIKGHFVEPHPISPYDQQSFGFETIRKSIQQVFANTVVIPAIMVASTDTRWYLPFTKSVYRFSPAFLTQETTKLFHGHNERITIDNYLKVVNFYHHIMINSDRKHLDPIKVKDEF